MCDYSLEHLASRPAKVGDGAINVAQMETLVDPRAEWAQIFRETLTFMLENAQTISRATKISSVSKYLERIADHATNIAEMVIFMVKGKSIRHMKELPPSV